MSESRIGDASIVSVPDSYHCPNCQADAKLDVPGSRKQLLLMVGEVEYSECECGQYLMIVGRQGCGSRPGGIFAISKEEFPSDLVPAGS